MVTDICVSRRRSLWQLPALALTAGAAADPLVAAGLASSPPGGLVPVTAFGATGDGRTDDTDAFNRAIASGQSLWIPAATAFYRITRPLRVTTPGQSLFGAGPGARIVQTGAGEQADALILAAPFCRVDGLALSPGPEPGGLAFGWGVVLAADGCLVEACTVTRMRRGGVLIADANDCTVSGNRFLDSIVRGDGSEPQSRTGYDVLMLGSASRNLVTGNHCTSGCGVGIGCQTAYPGKSQYDNVIVNNVIAGHPAYGVMAYLSDPADAIDRIMIAGNNIARISGSVPLPQPALFWGAGIYVQTSNDFVIEGNIVRDTNTDRSKPFSGSAVPAAIAVSGFGHGIVTGNLIDGCWHGIASIQTTVEPRPGDGSVISGNQVRRCARTGILLIDCTAARVSGNRLIGSPGASQGVLARRVRAPMRDLAIDGNDVSGFGVGIEVNGTGIGTAIVTGNRVSGNSGWGVYTAAEASLVHQNIVTGVRGIAIAPTVETGSCADNVVPAGEEGVSDGSGGRCRIGSNAASGGRRGD